MNLFFCCYLSNINDAKHVRPKLINSHRYLLLDDINFQGKEMRINAGLLRNSAGALRDARTAIFHVTGLLACGSSN